MKRSRSTLVTAGPRQGDAWYSADMSRETAADRLRLAMAMQREGTERMRRNIQRAHPGVSEAELETLLDEWLLSREPDAPGRPVSWPRRRTPSARRTR